MKPWILPVAIILVKVVLNLSNALYLRIRYKQYLEFMEHRSLPLLTRLRGSKSRTLTLMKYAGIENKQVSITQSVGYNLAKTSSGRLFDNYPSAIRDIAAITAEAFEEAIGTYKGRAIDAINPLYWLSLIVYLPTRVCSSLGAKADSVPVKILQGIYWLVGVVTTALFAFAKPTVIGWLRGWLETFPA